MATMDVTALRRDFPLLQRKIEGRQLTYLDSAATTAKPRAVLDAINTYYEEAGANIHRGKHTLSEESSDAYEAVRRQVARYIGASPREIIFTSGATASINIVALGLEWRQGDNVVTTLQEHHSNLLPWQGRAEIRFAAVGADGAVSPDAIEALIDDRTRLVAVSHASNVTGAIHPVEEICARVRARGGALVLVDAAQSVPHGRIDVRKLGCDFLAFSGHKLLGPTGAGVLYGRAECLESLGVSIRGGGAVSLVGQDGYTLKPLPYRLEPGTPNIAGVIGLGAAISYLEALGGETVHEHHQALAERLTRGLVDIPGTRLLGPSPDVARIPIASLVIESATLAADHVAMLLSDGPKIMVRSGHHCCHPYFDSLGAAGAVRASAYLYNTLEEIDAFVGELRDLLHRLHR